MTQPPPVVGPGGPGAGHLDLDTLADLDEDLLAPDVTAAHQGHLETCAECRDLLDRIRGTRALLGSLPADPMPDGVARRIDAALATAPATTIVPFQAKRRGWRAHPTAAGLGAAAAVAALVGALVIGRTSQDSDRPAIPGTLAEGRAGTDTLATLPKASTGTNYTSKNLSRKVPALVNAQGGTTGAGTGGGAAVATPTPAGGAVTKAAGPSAAVVPPALRRLYSSPSALADCVRAVEAGSGRVAAPLAIDFARFDGQPTVLIVLPGLDAGNLDAWFVGPRCSAADANLVSYLAVSPSLSPSPSPSPSASGD